MLVCELPVAGSYRLVVCDVRGRRVRTVADHPMRPGLWQTEWNGQDEAGERVGPGVYFIRLSGPSESRSAKVMFQP
jgi:flagellar hook assembly protein FlgD